MPYLIGTDEAGYGPRLGPLLISLSLWRVEQPPQEVDLFTALADTVCAAGTNPGDNRLKIDDSKKLYQSGGSVRGLERPVLSSLQALHRKVETWRDAWHLLVGQTPTALKELPWYCDYDESLPIDTEKDDIAHLATQWNEQWRVTQCELLELRSIPLFPAELNKEIDALDSKAEALTRATLRLIADVARKTTCRGDTDRVRQAWGKKPLSPGTPATVSRKLGEGPYRIAFPESLSIRRSASKCRNLLSAAGRVISPHGTRVARVKIFARIGNASIQSVLGGPRRKPEAHGRLSCRRGAFSPDDRTVMRKEWPSIACMVENTLTCWGFHPPTKLGWFIASRRYNS